MKIFRFLGIIVLSLWCVALYGEAEKLIESESVYNWKHAKITSRISLDMLKAKLRLPSDRNTAFAIIRRKSPFELKDAYLALPVDSSTRIGDYIADGTLKMSTIIDLFENQVQIDTALSHTLHQASVYHSIPMQQLAKLFVHHSVPYQPRVFPSHSLNKVYTGIIIDARGKFAVHGEYMTARLEPALFPKIWNSEMELIFEKNMVEPSIARKTGIVHYDESLNEEVYRDRVGANPLRIIARGIFGQNRTDIIIAEADSAQIVSRPENLQLLKEGKITIICDDASLRTPIIPTPDENFYFAYHDVQRRFSEKAPDEMEISRPGKDIKLTMYDIRFVADQADILPEEKWKLDIIAETLVKLGKNADFLIEGHTANLHRPKNELKLSVERAQRIADELSLRGIDASRFETAGYGSTRPRAPSDTAKNRAKNRRVEITILRE